MMSHEPQPERPAFWLLRRGDQTMVAAGVFVGLGALLAWWLVQGGWQGRLVEIDRARPQSARFQVDLNRAAWPELAQLPGIGEALARRIIESRQTEGRFRTLEDLLRVRGIGPKRLEELRPYLRADAPAVDPAR